MSNRESDMEKLKLNKFDCVKRQLMTAIELYFEHGDPVSIHTLTCAAYNTLRDITDQRGAAPMHAKHVYVKLPGKFSLKDLNEAENFFKHADKDPEADLMFYPKITEPLLMDCCSQYSLLTGETVLEFDAFQLWFLSQDTENATIPENMKEFAKAAEALYAANNRQGFVQLFEDFLAHLQKPQRGIN